MTGPVALGFHLRLKLPAAIADEYGRILLPGGLETEIVINPAVGEEHLRRERLELEIMTRIGGEGFSSSRISNGDSTGGKAEDAATAWASGIVGFLTSPTR